MPNIKSAKKKNRQDIKRTKINNGYLERLKKVFKGLLKTKDEKSAYSIIDKAAKKKIIHKNKAARLKNRVMKLLKNIK